MSIPQQTLIDIFALSLGAFLEKEKAQILNDVSERSWCGRLALYLQEQAARHGLIGYYADVEYNRKQNGQVKTIIDHEMKVVAINCDLILHSRGQDPKADNLIAIEVKKVNRPAPDKQNDRYRLMALTKSSYDDVWSYDGNTLPEHVCGYRLGAYIEVDKAKSTVVVELFQGGKISGRISQAF